MSFVTALNSKDFVVTAHLNLAEFSDKMALMQSAEMLESSVDAVQLPDSTQLHISGIAAAAILLQQGIDPVIHMNCRDRNRIALHQDITGAAALGVTSVLIKRGEQIPGDNNKGVQAIHDVPALELMAYIQGLKQEDDAPIDNSFLVGAAAEIFDPELDWTPTNLTRKCEAGVNFVQTQLCFDMDIARNYMNKIVAARLTHKTRFMLALAPLPSAQVARWIKSNVKGAILPGHVVKRLAQSPDPERTGIEICAELMCEMASIPGVSGVNLHKFGQLDAIPAAIRTSGLRGDT